MPEDRLAVGHRNEYGIPDRWTAETLPYPPCTDAPHSSLRIMMFLHSFEPGGVERVALKLAGGWRQLGCEVMIAMGRRGGALEREVPEHVRLLYARPNFLAAPIESLWLVPHLVAMVRKHRPDVLFCAGNTYTIVAVLVRLILGSDCPPIVCKVSNSFLRPDLSRVSRWFYQRWVRLQTRFIDQFVGMIEAMRPEIAEITGQPADRIAIVADPALFVLPGRSLHTELYADGGFLLAIGRLVPQKNLGLLLRAFALIGGDARLVILGDGPERARLERMATTLGIADRVEFLGHVPDPTPWLRKAALLVLSSDYEGVPAVIIEAMASGIPVVSTLCSRGIGELLDHGRLGRIVPRGDSVALAAAIESSLASPPDPKAMRLQASRFTLSGSARGYAAILAAASADADRLLCP